VHAEPQRSNEVRVFWSPRGRPRNGGVPMIPMYDTGPNSAERIAKHAAMNGVTKGC